MSKSLLVRLVALVFLSTVSCNSSNSYELSIPSSPPEDASAEISQTFSGLAFNPSTFHNYTGDSDDPNEFSVNLINDITSRTQVTPNFRVGGTAGDFAYFNPDQAEWGVYTPTDRKFPLNVTFGPEFYKAYNNFDATYIAQIPLVYGGIPNITGSLLFAHAIQDYIDPDKFLGLGVGNEPSLYASQGARPAGYSVQDFVNELINVTATVSEALGFEPNYPIYMTPDLASAGEGQWTLQNMWESGLSEIRERMTSVAGHYYQSNANGDLQTNIMNHTAVVQKMSKWVDLVDYAGSLGLPVRIDEAGSALNLESINFELEENVGNALWQVDWQLYCMIIGIAGVNMQQIQGIPYSAWQPLDFRGRPARVSPAYYSQVFIADWIGTEPGLTVSNIDQDSDFLSVYVGYVSGMAKRVAIINMELWSSDSGGERPSAEYQVTVPASCQKVSVKYLISEHGGLVADSSDISWDDYSWTYETGGTAYKSSEYGYQLDVQYGQVTVPVNASSAVMLVFE